MTFKFNKGEGKMSIFGEKKQRDVHRPMPQAPTLAPDMEQRPIIRQKQPDVTPLYNVAGWLVRLTYLDLMHIAKEFQRVRGDRPLETPEQVAAVLVEWAQFAVDDHHRERKSE